ncbi:MAG TPA: hypothetical protein VFK38_09645 [Candidatus Limnocylindrales bacterium]|nr:hypothetical protein [Candidatus Limnocylindrales bacterium]
MTTIPRWRLILLAGASLVLLVASASFARDQLRTASTDPAAAPDRAPTDAAFGLEAALAAWAMPTVERQAAPGDAHARGDRKGHFRGPFRRLERLVHAEAVLDLPEKGLTTVAADHGTLTLIAAGSVSVREADGRTVTITTGAETRVRKGGERVELSALAAGDEVYVMSVKEGGAFVARMIIVPREKPADSGG